MSDTVKRIKQFISAVTFLGLAVLVFCGASSITVGSKYVVTYTGAIYKNPMYNIPENTLDIVSLGPSSGMTSFSPLELWKEHGISAYNFSSEQQSPIISYYYLKEIIKRQDIKVVLLNTQMMLSGWDTGLQRKAFDRLALSFDKFEGAKDFTEMREYDSLFSYVFPLYKFHTRWKGLNNLDFSFEITNVPNRPFSIHNGYLMGDGNQAAAPDWFGLEDTGTATYTLTPDANEYFSKLIRLCQSEDIAVVLYSQIYNGDPVLHNTVQAFANSFGVPFVDFHMKEIIAASGIDLATDIGGHQSTSGAIRGSIYLGKYLKEHYVLQDHRGDSRYDWIDDELPTYEKNLFEFSLRNIQSLSEYLDILQRPEASDYSVFFSVKDEASAALTDELRMKLNEFGLQTDFAGKYRHSFIAVWQNGHTIYEMLSDTVNNPETDALTHEGFLPSSEKYIIKSAGYECGNSSTIMINETQYSKDSRGFNIVVYDNEEKLVVDSVNWDTCGEAGINAKR